VLPPCIPTLTGFQQLWLLEIIVPLLSLSILFSPPVVSELALQLPSKNNIGQSTFISQTQQRILTWNIKDVFVPRYAVYLLCRSLLTVSMACGIYVVELAISVTPIDVNDILGAKPKLPDLTKDYQTHVSFARNCMLFWFVIYLCTLSMNHVHRYNSIVRARPYRNKVWVVAVALCVVLQGIFWATSPRPKRSGPYEWVLAAGSWVLVLAMVDGTFKRHDAKLYKKAQRKRKIFFDTKLGMHSPVIGGQYIDEIN